MPAETKGRACEGKRRYNTPAAAEVSRRSLIRNQGAAPQGLRVYRCRHCSGYHVGHWRVGKR